MALDVQVRRLKTGPVSKGKAGPSSRSGGAGKGGKGKSQTGTEARVPLQVDKADGNTTTTADTGETPGGTTYAQQFLPPRHPVKWLMLKHQGLQEYDVIDLFLMTATFMPACFQELRPLIT